MAHNKTLTTLLQFKVALFGPIFIAVIVAAFIGYVDMTSENLKVCFSSNCINEAIGRLRLPLAIASLAFPLVALVASNHRSAQTAAQIQATESKNSFENNMKHREQFDKKLIELENLYKVSFSDKQALYDLIFSKNDYSRFIIFCDDMAYKKNEMTFENYFTYIDDDLKKLNELVVNKIDNDENRTFKRSIQGHIFTFLSTFFLIQKINGVSHSDFIRISSTKISLSKGELENVTFMCDITNSIIRAIRNFCLSQKYYKTHYLNEENNPKEDKFLKRNEVVLFLHNKVRNT